MPYVESSIIVAGPKRPAYEIAKDFERYPEFMPDVKELKIVERGDGYSLSHWVTKAAGRTIEWTEKDVCDDENCHITYKQVSGDLAKFEGEWRFEEVPEGTRVVLTVDFDMGIPMFASMLNPVLTMAVRSNSEKMLKAIKARVEGRN